MFGKSKIHCLRGYPPMNRIGILILRALVIGTMCPSVIFRPYISVTLPSRSHTGSSPILVRHTDLRKLAACVAVVDSDHVRIRHPRKAAEQDHRNARGYCGY